MTQGFYEQLGVDPSASTSEIRAAYTRLVAQLLRRRKAVVERGGDPSPLELARNQADEAWKVLSDPVRRRRYDAMRAVTVDGFGDGVDSNELWKRAGGALVHPAAGAAAELLRVVTTLKTGALPPAPRPSGPIRRHMGGGEQTATSPGQRAAHSSATPVIPQRVVGPTIVAETHVDTTDPEISAGRVVPLRSAPPAPAPPEPGLRVVSGSPGAPAVMMMPPPSARRKTLSAEDVARLVDRHGHSGAMLRAVREAKGLSLQDMSDTTRISVRYLEAIEADQHDHLPSATFVRGYVREVARMLELDEESTVSGYMRRLPR